MTAFLNLIAQRIILKLPGLMLIPKPPVADKGKEVRALSHQICRSGTSFTALTVITSGTSEHLQVDHCKQIQNTELQERTRREAEWGREVGVGVCILALHLVDGVTLDN